MTSHIIFHGRLISKGTDYGVHSFVCKIKDDKTQEPLKGIEIKRAETKFDHNAYEGMYVIFNGFQIPKESLLSRYTSISKNGGINTVNNPKIEETVKLYIHLNLLKYDWKGLFKLLLFACNNSKLNVEYDMTTGFKDQIRHETTENQLLPYVSVGYAIFFTYSFAQNNISENPTDLYSTLNCLKTFYLNEITEGIHEIKDICGSNADLFIRNMSNLTKIISPNDSIDDEISMYKHNAKEIFKKLSQLRTGAKLEGVYSYLNEFNDHKKQPPKLKLIKSAKNLIEMIKVSLLNQISKTGELLMKKNSTMDQKWNKLYMVDIIKTAKINAIYQACKTFYDELEELSLSDGLHNSLLRLCTIFCGKMIIKYCDNIVTNSNLDAFDFLALEKWINELIKEAAPQLFSLVQPSLSSLNNTNTIHSESTEDCSDKINESSAESSKNKEFDRFSVIKDHLRPLQMKLKLKAKI